MSYAAIKWSYSPDVLNLGLKPSALAVLRALCWFYRDENTTELERNCYPSVETLASVIGATPNTVNLAKNALARHGLVTWERAANFDTVGKKTNSYRLNCPALMKILERNQKLRSAAEPPKDWDETNKPHPLKPGLLYVRPDQKMLAEAFNPRLNAMQADWLSQALAFVQDTPEHREKLYEVMTRRSDIGYLKLCRATLNRVLKNSYNGRMISDRFRYLMTSLHNARAKKVLSYGFS